MSNKLTRSGLAFMTAVALTLTGLAAAPAYADAESVDIYPAVGSTYESINQSGVVIATETEDDTSDLKWQITSANSNYTTGQILDLIDSGDLNIGLRTGEDEFENYYDEVEDNYYNSFLSEEDFDGLLTTVDVQGGAIVVTPYEDSTDLSNDVIYSHDYEDTLYLSIWTEDDTNLNDIKLSVRSFDDENDNNEITFGEARSTEAVVTLYDVRTITSVTTVETANVGQSFETKTVLNKPGINTWFVTDGIAPGFGHVVAAHFNSTSTTLAGAWDRKDDYDPQVSGSFATNAGNVEDGIELNFPLHAFGPSVSISGTSENYSSRAWYSDGDSSAGDADFVKWLSPRSATSAVFAGNNAAVDGIDAYITEGDNLVEAGEDNVDVREGTKAVVVSSQIQEGEDDLLAANVRVRAHFTIDSLDEDSEVSVAGVTGSLDEEDADTGAKLTAFGRTDAKGVVSFTLNNSQGEVDDNVYVEFEVLLSNGEWEDSGDSTLDLTWVEAFQSDFTVSDNAISGNSITLEYEATDQFGVGISFSDLVIASTRSEDALQVTLMGLDDNLSALDKTGLAPTTKPLVNGKASFTFTNYAAVDSFVFVIGMLHRAEYDADDLTTAGDEDALDFETTQVFKNDATKAIESVENEYQNIVTYSKFFTGSTEDNEDLLEDVQYFGVFGPNEDALEDGAYDTEDTYEDTYVYIAGSVETANGNGAALQTVTLTGAGLQFEGEDSSGTYGLGIGSYTTETDIDGNFYVYVYSQKHNTSGQTITITSGGKSTTTLLKTYMNPDIDENVYFNGTSWVDAAVIKSNWRKSTGNAPGFNTAYNVRATATDVWGNILERAVVLIDADELAGTVSGFNRSVYEDAINISEDLSEDYSYYEDFTGGEDLEGLAFTNDKGQVSFDIRAIPEAFANRIENFELDLEILAYDYEADEDYDFTAEGFGSGRYSLNFTGFFGPQATAKAGPKVGVVRANAYNVKGKTVRVFVAGKLVATTTSDKARFLVKVKGIKAGDKRVTIKVGKKRMFSGFITVR